MNYIIADEVYLVFLKTNKLFIIIIGELYARAFLREGEQHPVETVIDSSRLVSFLIEV